MGARFKAVGSFNYHQLPDRSNHCNPFHVVFSLLGLNSPEYSGLGLEYGFSKGRRGLGEVFHWDAKQRLSKIDKYFDSRKRTEF